MTDSGRRLRPLAGFWHAHVGWLFDGEITNAMRFSKDLLRDPLIVWVNRHYLLWVVLGLAIPAGLGLLWTGTPFGAFQGFLWGGLVRIALNQHATWSIGSLAHIFGDRPFDTGEHEQSRNNIWLALPILGDGWHNNHHAFPHAAISGFRWWQLDPSAWIIRGLEALGLAWNVNGVPELSSQRRLARAPAAAMGGQESNRRLDGSSSR
jgi:stearoyl-CoA desaturase (delta-9 desaturase)